MKRLIIIVILVPILLTACKENKEQAKEIINYASFGDRITNKDVLSKEEMMTKFSALQEGDTVNLKFASTINEVCKEKGCWMKLDLGKEHESMVRFKDYGFFVPKDADNKEVIVEGKAYITKISVDELRHYAKDGGKSIEEIEKITEPQLTYAFEAHGVLLRE
jgi:hypothetical protein